MCGICGFTWRDEALVSKMNDAITHRGPDQDGVYEADLQSGAAAFGLYIDGAAGGSSIKVELAAAPPNQTITLSGILQGTTLDGLFRKVYTTDAATTATTIIALY